MTFFVIICTFNHSWEAEETPATVIWVRDGAIGTTDLTLIVSVGSEVVNSVTGTSDLIEGGRERGGRLQIIVNSEVSQKLGQKVPGIDKG